MPKYPSFTPVLLDGGARGENGRLKQLIKLTHDGGKRPQPGLGGQSLASAMGEEFTGDEKPTDITNIGSA